MLRPRTLLVFLYQPFNVDRYRCFFFLILCKYGNLQKSKVNFLDFSLGCQCNDRGLYCHRLWVLSGKDLKTPELKLKGLDMG